MPKLTLISFPLCPFVQRAVIALKEKGAAFDVVYVDLSNKPDWFLALSPLGKVPVLKVERSGRPDAVVFESAVIVEYLEETATGVPLHPTDPLERAHHRAWIEFASATLGDLWKLTTSSASADVDAAKIALNGKLRRLEDALVGRSSAHILRARRSVSWTQPSRRPSARSTPWSGRSARPSSKVCQRSPLGAKPWPPGRACKAPSPPTLKSCIWTCLRVRMRPCSSSPPDSRYGDFPHGPAT
jgi:hypothetical protein